MDAKRILLVDDSVDARRTLLLLLQLWGFEACEASDGQTVLRLAPTFCPDVVLLDLGLPDLDGCEVARQLRQIPGLEKARLIALTGFGQQDTLDRCREAGIDQHLLKPVDPIHLRELLESQ